MAKKNKTVKALDCKVQDLSKLVETLKKQLNETKSDLLSTVETRETSQCRPESNNNLKTSKSVTNNSKSLKCNLGESPFDKNIGVERHMK